MNTQCLGHENEFQHYDHDLDGLEELFDVGFKLEIEDPPGNYSGPYLTLHYSVKRIDGRGAVERLDFHLARDHWAQPTAPGGQDEQRLINESHPKLLNDLRRRKSEE